MRVNSPTRYAAMVLLIGGLACAGNKARTAEGDPDQAAAARDTTSNPSGYSGMERDTAIAPQAQQQPGDTFLQNQGQGQPQDTAGYSGMERVDTTGQAGQGGQTDTTSGSWGSDTTGANQNGAGMDSSGQSRTGDTTGYDKSQQPSQDTTSGR